MNVFHERIDPSVLPLRPIYRDAVQEIRRLMIVLIVVHCLGCCATAIAQTKPARPNILFIIVDDQSALDLRTYNSKSQLQTPNIDRLAREGMVFDEAYHMGAFISAVCTPSRHMIKSGRTLWHLPIAPEANKHCPPALEQNTIAAVFNRAGYDTMRTGKPGNSYEAANKLFAVRKDAPGRSGVSPGGSAWHGEQVLEYLDHRAATKDRDPFLIYFGFSHPHDPRNGTPELLARYGATNHADPNSLPEANPKQPQLPVNYLPAHPFQTTLLPDQRDETQVSGVWKNRDERTIRNELGRYFACSESIDIQIGRVLQKLETMGELENTYVFYTSDHGIAIGRHGLQGKQNLYQHTWRVPFLVKGPGIQPGSRVEGNIYLLDCLATLCSLANIPAPTSNEGLSFKPVLDGQRRSIRDIVYGVHCGGTKPGMRCVKKGDWKLIKYDGDGGAVHETQLFNLRENPDELLEEHHDPRVIALTGFTPSKHQVNLANDPRYADPLKEMEALLLAEMRRHDDPWRLWNQPADGLTPPRGKGNLAVVPARPKTRFILPIPPEQERYARKANRVVIRHELGDVVAVIEIVSPGNKDRTHSLQSFVEKAIDLLTQQVNLLIIDPFPPGPHDLQGMHGAISHQLTGQPFELPPDKPLTLVAYQVEPIRTAYVEPIAVGDPLPDMPLFLFDDYNVSVPLEETYQTTWNVLPAEIRQLFEPAIHP